MSSNRLFHLALVLTRRMCVLFCLQLQSISLLIKNDTADDDSLNLGPIAGRRPKSGWSSVRVPDNQRVEAEPDARRQTAPAEKFIDLDSDEDQ